MGFLVNVLSAPFKVASGVVEGVIDAGETIINHESKDDSDVGITLVTCGLNKVAKKTLEKTSEALKDIGESEELL